MSNRFLVYSSGKLPDIFSAPLKGYGILIFGDGSQKPQDHDLLVLDGSSLSPGDFARHAADVKTMLENNRPVLVFRPTSAHKEELAKANILRHYIRDDSFALLIEPWRDASGNLRVALAEQFDVPRVGKVTRSLAKLNTDNKPESVQSEEFEIYSDQHLNLMDLDRFTRRIRDAVKVGKGCKVQQEDSSGDVGPNNPPGNIPATLWDKTPINLYYPLKPSGAPADGYTPPTGNITMEALVTIGVYYDNLNFSTPIQWLLIEHSGHYYTSLVANDKTHLGWSLGSIYFTGDSLSSQTMVTKQSSPNNVNNQTQYTTSTEFSVGLQAGTEGISANTSYSIGSSQTSTIYDWKIAQSTPNSWVMAQQVPYDGTTLGTFPNGAAGENGVTPLPTISTGTLAFNTQTVWDRIPATKDKLSVNYTYLMVTDFTWSEETGKYWHAWCWGGKYSCSMNYAINFQKAYPTK